ncbi:MAG: shikimate kinase [Acholeplasmataceae bacterium]|nr:shikimate kinase [Acholeplasmataceae bacterium]
MKIYLIGLPTVGKSKIGKLIAKRIEIPFFDLDELITKLSGESPKEIITKKGESYFRKLETQALKTIDNPNCVIACGGGVVVTPENKALMDGLVVYLKVNPKDLVIKYDDVIDRPVLAFKGINKLYLERKSLYKKFMNLTINLKGLTDEKIIRKVVKAYEKNLNN